MPYIKESEYIILSVEKRKLSVKEKKLISDYIAKRKKHKKSLRKKTTLRSKSSSAQ